MCSKQQMVREFHKTFGVGAPDRIEVLPHVEGKLRCDMLREEVEELQYAFNTNNIRETADAIGDILYLAYGAAVAAGIDIEPIFAEIHRSNMTKLPVDGVPLRRADGKILKPYTWQAPNIEEVLYRQISEAADEMEEQALA